MAGCPIRRARKAGARISDGSVVAFPHLSQPRAGLSHAEWRARSLGEKLERLFGMSLDQMAEILSQPVAELDPARLNAVVTVARVVLLIDARAGLFEKARHERERQRIVSEMMRREFGDGIGTGKNRGAREWPPRKPAHFREYRRSKLQLAPKPARVRDMTMAADISRPPTSWSTNFPSLKVLRPG